jgi:membrane protein YdbS with pleckstrin-like domain
MAGRELYLTAALLIPAIGAYIFSYLTHDIISTICLTVIVCFIMVISLYNKIWNDYHFKWELRNARMKYSGSWVLCKYLL